jgi:hypothetical protein
MSKRFPWAGLLLIVALFIVGAAGAAEPPAGLAPMAAQAASCRASSSASAANIVASVLPPWIEAGATLCGDGCPATGQGTDPSCRGKMTGDSCGSAGGICLLVLTPTCTRSAARCSCITR